MKQKRVLTAALSAVLALSLMSPALAAEETAAPETGVALTYEVVQRGEEFPIRVWGSVTELGELSLTLENSNESDQYQKVVVNVDEDSLLLDAVTGEVRSFSDIQMGETVYAWVGPALTRGLPPLSTGRVLLCGIPADYGVPSCAEVETVTETEDGLDVCTNDGVILHLGADTEYLAAPGEEEPLTAGDIVPGARLLSWYSVTTLSLPAQAAPTKVMVFPSAYAGWVSVHGLEIALNGESLVLEGAFAPKVEEDRLLVPMRPLAEALGCEVSWEPYTNQVTVTREGTEVYRFTIGADQAVQGEVTMGLVSAAEAVDGVTFLALDDLIVLHDLKLADG